MGERERKHTYIHTPMTMKYAFAFFLYFLIIFSSSLAWVWLFFGRWTSLVFLINSFYLFIYIHCFYHRRTFARTRTSQEFALSLCEQLQRQPGPPQRDHRDRRRRGPHQQRGLGCRRIFTLSLLSLPLLSLSFLSPPSPGLF